MSPKASRRSLRSLRCVPALIASCCARHRVPTSRAPLPSPFETPAPRREPRNPLFRSCAFAGRHRRYPPCRITQAFWYERSKDQHRCVLRACFDASCAKIERDPRMNFLGAAASRYGALCLFQLDCFGATGFPTFENDSLNFSFGFVIVRWVYDIDYLVGIIWEAFWNYSECQKWVCILKERSLFDAPYSHVAWIRNCDRKCTNKYAEI